MRFGKYAMPLELEPGSTFSGFKVVSAEQTEAGFVWVFERSNKAMVLSMPYDEFFDLISSRSQGEYLMDEMAGELHRQFRQKELSGN